MESWRRVWRDGVSPQLSTLSLEALEQALLTDDPRLLQGATTTPPPLQCVQDWPVEAACPIGYCAAADMGGFIGSANPALVAEVEEFFGKACYACDQAIQEPAACRWFLNFWDESPREEVRPLLLTEVQRILSLRQSQGI